jgi:hypothetical protein
MYGFSMKIFFEHHYQKRILEVSFEQGTTLSTLTDIEYLKTEWLNALKTWHSPYKALLNLNGVSFALSTEAYSSLENLLKLLRKFFLKKAVGYSAQSNSNLPFLVVSSRELALQELGAQKVSAPTKNSLSFRESLVIEHDFFNKIIELSAKEALTFADEDHINILKSKLTNALMQWHSNWSLLINAESISFATELDDLWKKLEKYFSRLFMDKIIVYNLSPENYAPFQKVRSRHKAISSLKTKDPLVNNNQANCQTRKTKPQ